MKSSSAKPLPRSPIGFVAAGLAVVLLSGTLVALVRPGLVARFHRLRTRSDVYALPSPEQTIVASLGYRSALADLLLAHVLVSYGLHFEEQRRFEFVGNYLDTINALDSKFRQPYYLADTFLTLQPQAPPLESYVKARQILERGMEELPYDARLWSQAGQFLAYLGPSRFDDPVIKAEWHRAGARRLARACELVSDDETLPYHCIAAAGMLSKQGHVEAMVQFLERVLAVSDNEEIRALALGILQQKAGERQRAKIENRYRAFEQVWAHDLSFASKDLLLVLGPPFDPARCITEASGTRDCASTWRAWSEQR